MNDFRIRVCRQGELRVELEREQKTVKWGKISSRSEVFFDVTDIGQFCTLSNIAGVAMEARLVLMNFTILPPIALRI
jgi:hypothetical protein